MCECGNVYEMKREKKKKYHIDRIVCSFGQVWKNNEMQIIEILYMKCAMWIIYMK